MASCVLFLRYKIYHSKKFTVHMYKAQVFFNNSKRYRVYNKVDFSVHTTVAIVPVTGCTLYSYI